MQCDSLQQIESIGAGRRRLLRALGGFALAAAGGGTLAGSSFAQSVSGSNPFALGVASGDPARDGFVLWTTLALQPLARGGGMRKRPVEVEWMVAADERMTQPVQRGRVVARPEVGHAVHVEISGLEPAREYFYRFMAGGAQSRIGRTRTLPAAGLPSPSCVSPSRAASATRKATSPPGGASPRSASTSSSTTAITSTSARSCARATLSTRSCG
jgi:phosphodiesterase/alkaline phosphatase D-like protein